MRARLDSQETLASEGSSLETYVRSYLDELRSSLDTFDHSTLAPVVDAFERARRDQRQILILGNGGSAATASHLACDLAKGTADLKNPSFVRFRALSLTDNTALITALANDLTFVDVFAQQLASVMSDGDVVVFVSASGNSPNLVRAAEYAISRGAETVGLLGFGGGRLATLVDHPVVVSSRNYGISEDFHLIVQHVLTQYLRRVTSGPPRQVAFLDRDGIINRRPRPHEYVATWAQFRFVPGVIPMLRALRQQAYELVVVTNQQGVGKGVMSSAALDAIHEAMVRELSTESVKISLVLHCPHLERDQCSCRKPRPGLIHRALNELPFLVDLSRSMMIGDSQTDMQAGQSAGVRTRVFVGAAESAGPRATHVARS
ncbi:MAG TPA: HAD-IIIA family hydrolase, partial [Vicinamibacterales bacterium]|nr:HAD-IIIA family hydrolase [Vicinamibacterales bacterium]